MQSGTNPLTFFFMAIVVLLVIGPEKLPMSIEQVWLAIENFRRQGNDLPPRTLGEARKTWKRSGSPIYAVVGGLYQGAEHLSELRRRLMITAIVMFGTALVSLFFATYIFEVLKGPAGDIQLIFLKPAEMILTYFKVGLMCGFVVALPFMVYQLLLFILPAMETDKERRSFKLLLWLAVPSALLFFVGGLAFAYFVLLPFALRYLFQFGSEIAQPQWAISEYISFVLNILFWIGAAFETPLIMLVLSRFGVITAEQLKSKRKYAIIVVAVVAAVITPTPDPFNMALVMGPLYMLFELGLLFTRIFGKRKEEDKAVEEDQGEDDDTPTTKAIGP
jgi:sec-independent protein translocase protein TatC